MDTVSNNNNHNFVNKNEKNGIKSFNFLPFLQSNKILNQKINSELPKNTKELDNIEKINEHELESLKDNEK